MKAHLFFIVISVILFSCGKKEIKPHLGTYAVSGFRTGAPDPTPYPINYSVTFKNGSGSKIVIENFAKLNAELKATVEGETFTISSEAFITDNETYQEYSNIDGSGHFLNDSVYFEINYTNSFGEPYGIIAAGSKN